MAKLPANWKETLNAASRGARLSPSVAKAIGARIYRWGYIPEAHNFGRVLCKLPFPPHFHGQIDPDGVLRCVLHKGHYVRRWPSDLEGMRRLVSLASRGPGAAELAGFRSVYESGGGTAEHDETGGPSVTDRIEEALLLSNPVTAPIGVAKLTADQLSAPTEQAEHAFQLLTADWNQFETVAHVPDPPWDFLKGQHDAWIAFRDAWNSGSPDVTNLSSMASDADTVRKYLAEKDPQWATMARVDVPEVTALTPGLQVAQAIQDKSNAAAAAVASSSKDALSSLWGGIPNSVKIGGGAVLLVSLLLGLRGARTSARLATGGVL